MMIKTRSRNAKIKPAKAARRRSRRPVLRFSPTAWAKLLFMRDAGDTEVGGFGICQSDDLLRIDDFRLVRQRTTSVSVVFDDASVADLYDQQVDAGLTPQQFGRIWIHTHPGNCPLPSHTDETTFAGAFGSTDWSLMFILAQGGATYARLKFNVGPGGSLLLPVEVDYSGAFAGCDHAAWMMEYDENVQPVLMGSVLELGQERPLPASDHSRRQLAQRWDFYNERTSDEFW